MSLPSPRSLAVLSAALVLATGGASAALAAGGDAQITVSVPTTLHAGQTAPFDAAGVQAVRRGKPIPAGYVLVGREVTIDRGDSGSTGAVMELTCPAGKTARTLGFTGQNAPNPLDAGYPGHRTVRVAVWSPPRHARSHGTSYVVCR